MARNAELCTVCFCHSAKGTAIEQRIQQKSELIAEIEQQLRLLQAELPGLRTGVAALRYGEQPDGRAPDRTERILRQAEAPMRANLSYLERQGKVVSPARGVWAASHPAPEAPRTSPAGR